MGYNYYNASSYSSSLVLLEAIAAETLEGEYYSVTLDNIQSVYHKILAKITWKSVVLASRHSHFGKNGDTVQPIIDATTSATVVRPDGRIETLNLFDDGAHNDNAAGDGIYAGNYTNVNIRRIGEYPHEK